MKVPTRNKPMQNGHKQTEQLFKYSYSVEIELWGTLASCYFCINNIYLQSPMGTHVSIGVYLPILSWYLFYIFLTLYCLVPDILRTINNLAFSSRQQSTTQFHFYCCIKMRNIMLKGPNQQITNFNVWTNRANWPLKPSLIFSSRSS